MLRSVARRLVIAAIWAAVLAASAFAADHAWESAGRGMGIGSVQTIAADPQNPDVLYAGAGHVIYRSVDGVAMWKAVFQAPLEASITSLAIQPGGQTILAATTHGLYGSFDRGEQWKRLRPDEGFAVHVDAHQITTAWAGTSEGLLVSQDGGKTWREVTGPAAKEAILDLESADDRLLAVTNRGLAVYSADASWTYLLRTSTPESLPDDADENAEDVEDMESSFLPAFHTLALDPDNANHVYLGGQEGVHVSRDGGVTWSSLGSQPVTDLVHTQGTLYAATHDGVAAFNEAQKRWEVRSSGLPTHRIHRLAGAPARLYAATESGLFQLTIEEPASLPAAAPTPALPSFAHEPTIREVQQAAVNYAEVQPEKIAKWRRQAALKAWLPTFGVDYGRDVSTYLASSVTATSSRLLEAEDPSSSWDISLDWDLGELIWNDDQTSIDTRSKLMVQLRDDILNDVTRVYFERRRLQIELATRPATDPAIQLEKHLRLQELTAMLDASTGGWFSRQIDAAGGAAAQGGAHG